MRKIKFLFIALLSGVCFFGLSSCEKDSGSNLTVEGSNESTDESSNETEPYISWSDLEGIWVSNEDMFMGEIINIASSSYYTQAKLVSLNSNSTHNGFRITSGGYYQPVTVKLTSGLGTADNRVAEIAAYDGYVTWQATNDGGSTYLGSINGYLEDGIEDFYIYGYREEDISYFTNGLRQSLGLSSSDLTCKYSSLHIKHSDSDYKIYIKINSLN